MIPDKMVSEIKGVIFPRNIREFGKYCEIIRKIAEKYGYYITVKTDWDKWSINYHKKKRLLL